MIGIIDYNTGNTHSLFNAYRLLNKEIKLIKTQSDFKDVSHLILPGVGSFDIAMNHLKHTGLIEMLSKKVLEEKIPTLGICLGMQLMCLGSEEGESPGLGWINRYVCKFPANEPVPHMGWNSICVERPNSLLLDVPNESLFYFLHSYYVNYMDNDPLSSTTSEHSCIFTSSLNIDNIYAVQFHPEKSHKMGLKMLDNFSTL